MNPRSPALLGRHHWAIEAVTLTMTSLADLQLNVGPIDRYACGVVAVNHRGVDQSNDYATNEKYSLFFHNCTSTCARAHTNTHIHTHARARPRVRARACARTHTQMHTCKQRDRENAYLKSLSLNRSSSVTTHTCRQRQLNSARIASGR